MDADKLMASIYTRTADEQKRWYGMWAAVGFAIGIVVAWIGSVCW